MAAELHNHNGRWLAPFLFCLSLVAAAAESAPEGWQGSLSLTPVYLGSADVDGGGRYESRVLALNLGAIRSVGPRATTGVSFNYSHYENRFSTPGTFGPMAPWGDVERIGLSVPFFLRLDNDWTLMLTPSLDYFRERGADWDESLTYGAAISASRLFGAKRSIGIGAGVFDQFEEVKVFPFLAVDWQITEQWRLNNPLAAGPTGPAGLELNYRTGARWEFGIGAAYRRVRFRLREDGAFPGGVGEESGVATFLHAAAHLGADTSLDLYGGALLGGELEVEDRSGDSIAEQGFDTAPLFGATLRIRF